MSSIREALIARRWTETQTGSYQRLVHGSYAVALERYNGSLTVFVRDEEGGGSGTIPAGTPIEEMADTATQWAGVGAVIGSDKS